MEQTTSWPRSHRHHSSSKRAMTTFAQFDNCTCAGRSRRRIAPSSASLWVCRNGPRGARGGSMPSDECRALTFEGEVAVHVRCREHVARAGVAELCERSFSSLRLCRGPRYWPEALHEDIVVHPGTSAVDNRTERAQRKKFAHTFRHGLELHHGGPRATTLIAAVEPSRSPRGTLPSAVPSDVKAPAAGAAGTTR